MTLAGWSDAAYGDQSADGKCRLGYLIGLMPSSPLAPCHILQWISKFTRNLVKSSIGGDVYAPGEMDAHVTLLREIYEHVVELSPDKIYFEDRESLLARLRPKANVTEKFPIRHFLAIHQSLEMEEFENARWRPGCGDPADGFTKTKRDMVPLLRLTESGT